MKSPGRVPNISKTSPRCKTSEISIDFQGTSGAPRQDVHSEQEAEEVRLSLLPGEVLCHIVASQECIGMCVEINMFKVRI